NDIDGVGVVRIHFHRKAEIRWQSFSDVLPRVTGVVASIDAPMMLKEHAIWIRRMAHNFVHALAPLGILLIGRQEFRADPFVARFPALSAVFRAIDTAG